MEKQQENSNRWIRMGILVICALFSLFWFAERFSGISVWDDSFLYIRYADNLLAGENYAWNPGEPPAWGLTSQLYGLPTLGLRFALQNAPATLPLYLSSLVFGLIFLYFLTKILFRQRKTGEEKRKLIVLLLAVVAINAPNLADHFASGMDTTFSMAYLAVFIALLARWQEELSPGRAMVIGLWAGLAYFVRPDLLALTGPVAISYALFSKRREMRQQGRYLFIFFAFALLGQALFALRTFGSLLPLPFYVKSLNPYGPEFLEHYRFGGLIDFGIFAALNLIPIALIVFAFFKFPRIWKKKHSAGEKGLLVGGLIFALYFAFFVTPIMAYSQRFYYPLLPILLYFGGKSGLILLRGDEEKTQWKWKTKTWLSFGGIVIMLIGFALGMKGMPENLKARWGKFGLGAQQEYLGEHNWPMLARLKEFPADFSLATSELGLPGVMHPDKYILDFAGLNNPVVAKNGHLPDTLLARIAPDWLYMPHPHYAKMNRELRDSEVFQTEYELFEAADLGSFQAVAIRKKSPYFDQMKSMITAYISAHD